MVPVLLETVPVEDVRPPRARAESFDCHFRSQVEKFARTWRSHLLMNSQGAAVAQNCSAPVCAGQSPF